MKNTRSAIRTTITGLAIVLASLSPLPSAVLVVSQAPGSQYPTIQSAINAAIPGQDEVFVSCGTYTENITMRDGVHVRGADPHCSVLQPGSTNTAVVFPDLATTTELSDLTVRAHPTSTAISGRSGPVIITHNIVENSGRSIHITDGTGDVRPTITRNIIRDNSEGIWVSEFSPTSSSLLIANNLVVGSSGYIEYGFGIGVLVGNADVTVANNTVVGNRGGILAQADGGEVVVANNAVKSNTILGGVFAFSNSPSGPHVAFNVAWANAPYDYYSPPPSSNLTADPLFLNENPDFLGFEPRTGSPLIDRGDPQWAPVRDLRGVRRVSGHGYHDGPDIGARENEGLTRFRFEGGTGFTWDSAQWFFESEILRGDLRVLRQTGVWLQDTSQVPAAERFCEMSPTGFWDSEVPAPGEGYFYLVTAWPFQGCETTLGFMSGPQLRPGGVCWGACPVGP